MKVITAFIIWIGFGLIGAGFNNSYFQNKYQKCNDVEEHSFAMAFVIGGPINLFVAYLASGYGRYGWSLKFNACGR